MFDTDDYAVKDGTVIRLLPSGAVVRVDKDEEECKGCGVCPMKGLCHGKDAGHLDLPVDIPPGARQAVAADDRVRIAYRPANAALAALVMFVPALAGLLAGGLLGWRLAMGDAVLVLGCGVGIALGVAVSAAAAKLSPSLKPKTKFLERSAP